MEAWPGLNWHTARDPGHCPVEVAQRTDSLELVCQALHEKALSQGTTYTGLGTRGLRNDPTASEPAHLLAQGTQGVTAAPEEAS